MVRSSMPMDRLLASSPAIPNMPAVELSPTSILPLLQLHSSPFSTLQLVLLVQPGHTTNTGNKTRARRKMERGLRRKRTMVLPVAEMELKCPTGRCWTWHPRACGRCGGWDQAPSSTQTHTRGSALPSLCSSKDVCAGRVHCRKSVALLLYNDCSIDCTIHCVLLYTSQ